ncbi:MAG: hypothetical protein AABW84_02860 [Nanoarchaeota archaeon]
MKFNIHYSEESFERYMSRRTIPHIITKTENIILLAIMRLKINTDKISQFTVKFRHGHVEGYSNLFRYPKTKEVELTLNLRFIEKSSKRAIENIIYHELGHLRDMLDPKYNYMPAQVDKMSEEMFKKFVTIWNINIDSRLNNKRLPSAIRGRKEDIRYFHIPNKIVKKIWNKFVNFSEMAKMARNL